VKAFTAQAAGVMARARTNRQSIGLNSTFKVIFDTVAGVRGRSMIEPKAMQPLEGRIAYDS
jgi:hypothetical protein